MRSIGLGRYILAAKYFEQIMFCPGGRYDQIAAAGGPADQWDALPTNAKLQIIVFVGLLELYSESANVRCIHPCASPLSESRSVSHSLAFLVLFTSKIG